MSGIFGLISSGISAFGQMQAAQAQQQAARLNAFNTETDKVRVKIQTVQNHNDRLEQWRSNTSTNKSMFFAMGRDVSSDASVKAYLNKQKDIVGEDADRIDYMGQAQMAKLQQQATAMRIEGRAKMQAGRIGALTTIATGINNYMTTR